MKWTLYVQSIPTNTIAEMESDSNGGGITISGNSVTLETSSIDTGTAGSYRYSLRDITAGMVLAKGKFIIEALP